MSSSDLKQVFMQFCKFGDPSNKGTMTGAKFFKFTKDCKIVDSKVTRTSIDLLFSKIKAKGARTIAFSEFKKAIPALAKMKYGSDEETPKLMALITANGSAKSSGTKAKKNKFHDDKSLYTGVYARGGPDAMANQKITLSKMMDRSGANVRGVNDKYDHNK
mmetsp:Transcript_30127/g.56296  ORF Transcript_30127/g.56296 Transcript_30127/m.56296 type:complete len:161 (-) Transcript_30127:153-635(-)